MSNRGSTQLFVGTLARGLSVNPLSFRPTIKDSDFLFSLFSSVGPKSGGESLRHRNKYKSIPYLWESTRPSYKLRGRECSPMSPPLSVVVLDPIVR